MGLQQQLDAFKAEFARTALAGRSALYDAKIEELRASFALERAIGLGDQARWLSVAAGKVAYGPCAARLVTVFGYKLDADEAIGRAHGLLKVLEGEITETTWIAGTSKPSIADVALYSYIDRAPEGNVDLAPYPSVRAWLRRVEALPGFVPLQKTRVGLEV